MKLSQENFEIFIQLSVALTGFKRTDLLGTGMAFAYFEIMSERTGHEASSELWKESKKLFKIADKDEEKLVIEIRKHIMSHSMYGPMARGLIKLWYLGQWEAMPGHWRNLYGNHLSDVNQIISSDSYREGLVWTAIGAHPMGAKQPGFGTWSGPPEKLSDI